MTYEDFEKFVREQCMYETMYYDSEGRLMLITTMLNAYGMVTKAQREWQGLTKEELDALVEEHSGWPVEMVGHVLICAAEDKLKEKNT